VTWTLLKDNVPNLISHVIFPLLCLTQEDLDLWEEDPVEYIHQKIGIPLYLQINEDVYEEYLTPDIAASRFLITLARKRQKSSFNGILQFINTTLSL
jgi:importin-7